MNPEYETYTDDLLQDRRTRLQEEANDLYAGGLEDPALSGQFDQVCTEIDEIDSELWFRSYAEGT